MRKPLWPVEDQIFTRQVGEMIGEAQNARLHDQLSKNLAFRTFVRLGNGDKIEVRVDNKTNNTMTKNGIETTPRKELSCRWLSVQPKPLLIFRLIANQEDALFDMFDVRITGHNLPESVLDSIKNKQVSEIIELPPQMQSLGVNLVRGSFTMNGDLFMNLGEEY